MQGGEVLELLAALAMVAGSVLAVVAAVGLIRFEDVFSRMQAASKPSTLGILLILGGSALVVGDGVAIFKLFLVVVLQFMTVPIGAHLVARAVYGAGAALPVRGGVDELAQALERAATDAEPTPD